MKNIINKLSPDEMGENTTVATETIQPTKVVKITEQNNSGIRRNRNSNMPNKRRQPQTNKKPVQTIKAVNPAQLNDNALKVVFLGGVGEIGKNMTALQYGDDIIVIDSGSIFPDEAMPGIDLVVPDITFLAENKDKVRGFVITHGHEDHIGSLPYVVNEINAPIFGSRMTLALIEGKLSEFPKIKFKTNTVKPRQVITLGCFKIEFIAVNHSIPGAMALSITTPVGIVFHTGDFKIDFTPIDGKVIDLPRMAEIGRKGVQLLLCESTNVERPGYTMSERTVGATLDKVFIDQADKRLIIATFASNVHRLQQIMDLALKYKRKVAFSGRSMVNVSEMAIKIGELKMDKSIIIDIDKVNKYPDKEVLIMSTGSQGEPMSALTRMASGDFNKIEIGENDCIVLSSSPIPGNEKSVNRVMNSLYKKGATIIYDELADVHVSGHGCLEEIKTIHSLINPKFFIPVHGEYRHLKKHQQLAVSMGMEERNTLICEIGDMVELTKNSIKKVGVVVSGERLVDGAGVGDTTSVVLRDRKQLAEDGICVCSVTLDPITREVSGWPDIITRGLIYAQEADELVKHAKELVVQTINEMESEKVDNSAVINTLRKVLASYFFKQTKRRPMILTIVR